MKRSATTWLVAIVGASFFVRTVLGWLRATPALFPDEYIYAALGRSLADSGRPLIRGGSAHFPALLQPLLTAPAWLIGDVDVAYRLVQTIGALAMSLAAVPVYLLARRLELSKPVGLALAALAVLVPDLVYASFVAAEPFAYPLVLAAVAAATAAITRPTRRSQLAFVLFAALAILARAQFAVLPVVFFLAVLGVGIGERRVRPALREHLLPLGLFLLPALAFIVAGPTRALGYYDSVLHLHLRPVSFLRWMGWDAMVLAYASGWIIVPGVLLGLWLAFRRPSSRPEFAFAMVASLLAVALIVEAGLLQANTDGQSSIYGVDEIKERYVFYLVPLAGICFALYARRGWPLRLPHLALAALLLVLAVRVPLSGFAVSATLDASPILYGVSWLAEELNDTSSASLAIAVAAGLLLAVSVAASRRPRRGTPLVLALALSAMAAASAGAVAFNVTTTAATKRTFLPRDPSFVDHSGLRHVALLQSSGGTRAGSLQHLFWNRSIERVLLLPGAEKFDAFDHDRVTIAADGALLVKGREIRVPLLVDGFGSTVRLRGARSIASGPVSTLWAPAGRPRLALYATGRYHDGWLARRGSIAVWPTTKGAQLQGRLTMTLTLPSGREPVAITFEPQDGRPVVVSVRPGGRARVDLEICSRGPWRIAYRSTPFALVGLRVVSARATEPLFTPGPGQDAAAFCR